MSTYVLIADGVVVNRVVASEPLGDGWIQSDIAQIGWLYDGESFSPPADPPPAVPASVTRRQAKQALALAGLLDQVQPAIDAIEDPVTRARWRRSSGTTARSSAATGRC
jgi:hypothetical protein